MNFDEIYNRLQEIEDLKYRISVLENKYEPGLCSSAFNNDKNTGLTFEEAIKKFKKGKSIGLKGSDKVFKLRTESCYVFGSMEIMSDEWEAE